jgi:hypothetical protein
MVEPTIRLHVATDRYAQVRAPALTWREIAALQRQAQHRADREAAYRGRRLLDDHEVRAAVLRRMGRRLDP